MIDFTKLSKRPVIYCSSYINGILLSYIAKEYKKSEPSQMLQKTEFQFNNKTLTLICDERLEWNNFEILLYDKSNKRLALKINYNYEHAPNEPSEPDIPFETYKSLIASI